MKRITILILFVLVGHLLVGQTRPDYMDIKNAPTVSFSSFGPSGNGVAIDGVDVNGYSIAGGILANSIDVASDTLIIRNSNIKKTGGAAVAGDHAISLKAFAPETFIATNNTFSVYSPASFTNIVGTATDNIYY